MWKIEESQNASKRGAVHDLGSCQPAGNKYKSYELSTHKYGQALKFTQLLLLIGCSEEQR